MSYKAVLTGYYPNEVGICQHEWTMHQQELISKTVIENTVRFQDSILCPNFTYTVDVRNAETVVKLVGTYFDIYEAYNSQSA